jgi:hypothetical protein
MLQKSAANISDWFEPSSRVRQGSVLSPILFNAMKDESVNKVRIKNTRPDMTTLISADDMLTWWKDEKEN